MTKIQKNIALTTTIIAILAFSIWLYIDFSFEPGIGVIMSIGGLTALGYPKMRAKYKKQRRKGRISFDYSNNNGIFNVGSDELLFETKWSKASRESIHLYKDPASIDEIAKANGNYQIKTVKDISDFDFSSRTRTIQKNEIAILKNVYGNYAAVKIIDIKDNTRGDDRDELTFKYVINPKGKTDFS